MSDSLKRIVWLASYPKSGNTWLRMFLQVYISGNKCRINETSGVTYRDHDELAYRSVSPVAFPDRRPEIAMGLRFPALLHLIQRAGNNEGDVIIKTHNVCAADQGGLHLCPPVLTKLAIYLIRDPRDVVVSFSHHLVMSIDKTIEFMCNENGHLEDNILGFGNHLSSWGNHTGSWIRDDLTFPVCTVRYEAMIADTRSTFYQIVEFLFGEVDEQKLDFAIRESSFENLSKQEKDNGFQEQKGNQPFFRVGKSGKWKEILTGEQVKKLEAKLGDAMERMGYKCVTREPSTIGSTT